MAGATRRPAVYVFSRVSGLADAIKEKNSSIEVINIPVPQPDGGAVDMLRDAEVVVTDPGLVEECSLTYTLPRLQWMQGTWAGVDTLMKTLDKNKPYPSFRMSRFGGSFGPHMAEYVCGHIISRERKFPEMIQAQRDKQWKQDYFGEYRILSQLTLGIIGAGDIGQEVARAVKTFGMKVIGVVRRDIPEDQRSPHVDQYKLVPTLPEVLASCDYVCNILPSTPATKGLLSGDVLSHCKNKKPVFINLGRGDVIDTESLINALNNDWISHAIVDVMEKEPLPESSPLWDHSKVTISPHVSAVSFGWQVAELFIRNYENFISGKPLDFEVDWERGY